MAWITVDWKKQEIPNQSPIPFMPTLWSIFIALLLRRSKDKSMSPNQYNKLRTQFRQDRTLRPIENGQIPKMLAAATRAENGSEQLSTAQYTTVTAENKKQYPRP